ncbi:MAG TPA: tetratricopeptide repeat-containing diguanylate cyclase [Xanthomonadaceae bacterium]|nr:tetratricopeptide repeat-containing diguanylate cyclase [Xanthomonadaceae bacterium]
MRVALAAMLWLGMAMAFATSANDPNAWRTLSASDPHGLIERGRQMLDVGKFNADPNGERELLWWIGHAAINASDDVALTEATSRLDSLGAAQGDRLALTYAGFLRADHKIEHGDPSGVSEALRAAAQLQGSADPAIRALVQFQVCDAYTMAGDTGHALALCRNSEVAYRTLGDAWDLAQAENDEGNVLENLGRGREAIAVYQRARNRYLALGDHSQAVMVGDNLAQVYLKMGRAREALELSRASLADERASGRLSDALLSRADIARALNALGQPVPASAEIAATVDEARAAHKDGLLTDLLRIQSELAESAGDLKLALATEREMVAVREAQRAPGIQAEEAALNVRYAAREKELRIHDLERDNTLQKLEIKAARSESARRDELVSRQRLSFAIAFGAALALAVISLLLALLLRAQRRHAAALRAQTVIDPLTGVENRRGFFQRADALLAAARPPSSGQHALMLVDIDYFKRINDSGGHPFGDLVLCAVVDCMRRVLGTLGTLARLGGEEFGVLCPQLGGEAALHLAERLRAEVATLRFPQQQQTASVTISIGLAMFDGERSHNIDTWMRNADDALYVAKEHGRNRVVASAAVR